jgi:predicted O-methyltransferase YrrM
MPEFTTIRLDKDMPIDKRIEEVNRRISEWIETLEEPFNHETDEFQLIKFDAKKKQYQYKYAIARGVKSLKKRR